MSAENNPNGNTNRNNNSTSVDCASLFNNTTSALKLGCSSNGFGHNFGTLEMSPVFAEMVGKQPARGEQVFNYDMKKYAVLTPTNLILLQRGVTKLEKGEMDEVLINTTKFEVSLITSALVTDSKAPEGSYFLYIKNKEDQSEVAFLFENTEYELGFDPAGEPMKEMINMSFTLFKTWLKEAISWTMSPVDFTARRMRMGTTNTPNSAAPTSAASVPGRTRRRADAPASSGAAAAPTTSADHGTAPSAQSAVDAFTAEDSANGGF